MMTSKINAAFVHSSPHSPLLFGFSNPNTRQTLNLLQTIPSSFLPEDNKIDSISPVIEKMNSVALNIPLDNSLDSTNLIYEDECVINGMPFSLASTLVSL